MQTEELGKRYRTRWALARCTLSVPAGHVVGLVGPNGAGKTTLINLATGMLAPSTGTIEVLGGRPAAGPAGPGRVPGPGRAAVCRAAGRGPPAAGRAPQPGLGRRTGALAGRAAGPGPQAEGRDAVWRAACPARAHPGR